MLRSLPPKLLCATCKDQQASLVPHSFVDGESGHIREGILRCDGCEAWYPISADVLELLPPELVYPQSVAEFQIRYADRLKALGCRVTDQNAPALASDTAQMKQREHFDHYAEGLKPGFVDYPSTPFWRAAAHRFLGPWRKAVTKQDGWMLDIGCGNGINSLPLADRCIVAGFDISKGWIQQAVEDARRAGHMATTSFFVADGTTLPGKDSSFDYAQTIGALHHMPDPERTTIEILRILKPGGLFYGVENNKSVFRGIFDWLMRVKPLWVEEAGAEPLISHEMVEDWIRKHQATVTSVTSVFLPPHLFNLFGYTLARWLLIASDAACSVIPWLRNQGGEILLMVRKNG